MGGSDATPDARDDARVVVVVGSPVGDFASDPRTPTPPPPVSTPSASAPAEAAEAKREFPAEAAEAEGKQQQAAAAAAATTGVQAMAVTVVRDVETGPEASTSGSAEEKPSWFTPKR